MQTGNGRRRIVKQKPAAVYMDVSDSLCDGEVQVADGDLFAEGLRDIANDDRVGHVALPSTWWVPSRSYSTIGEQPREVGRSPGLGAIYGLEGWVLQTLGMWQGHRVQNLLG